MIRFTGTKKRHSILNFKIPQLPSSSSSSSNKNISLTKIINQISVKLLAAEEASDTSDYAEIYFFCYYQSNISKWKIFDAPNFSPNHRRRLPHREDLEELPQQQ
ncbi:hypothetical protein WUBG_10074 [Wuchereria bancrofti]|uniref:Uncharacterized protein n=1 Tax=Wuchereria bancrofti TaxID=6293 RepID=J9EA46_WUCBA|nr:hypothetical protein WUBG_10074 [Wuchereria bancrofti]